MFKFLLTHHRHEYWQLAKEFHMWPDHVRKLAHGKHAKTEKEKKVCHALLDMGIIHRHH